MDIYFLRKVLPGMYDEKAFIKFQALYDGMDQNKTSTQWTPGS